MNKMKRQVHLPDRISGESNGANIEWLEKDISQELKLWDMGGSVGEGKFNCDGE